MQRSSCPFCDIAKGSAEAGYPSRQQVTAFLDWKPFNPGHVLVIPNTHQPDFEELPPIQLDRVMRAAQAVAKTIKKVYAPKKVGLAVAGFDVAHAHVHVLPLHDYHDLTSRKLLEGTLSRASQAELADHAKRIVTALEATEMLG